MKHAYFIFLMISIPLYAMDNDNAFAMAKNAIIHRDFQRFNDVATSLNRHQLEALYQEALLTMKQTSGNLNCATTTGLRFVMGAVSLAAGINQIILGINSRQTNDENDASFNIPHTVSGGTLFCTGSFFLINGIKYGIDNWNTLKNATDILNSMNERLEIIESEQNVTQTQGITDQIV